MLHETTDPTRLESCARWQGVRQESHLHAETNIFLIVKNYRNQFCGRGGLSLLEWCNSCLPLPGQMLIDRPEAVNAAWGGQARAIQGPPPPPPPPHGGRGGGNGLWTLGLGTQEVSFSPSSSDTVYVFSLLSVSFLPHAYQKFMPPWLSVCLPALKNAEGGWCQDPPPALPPPGLYPCSCIVAWTNPPPSSNINSHKL